MSAVTMTQPEVLQRVKYPLIAEHGLIGDLQTCALVSSDGTIDWFCTPRFDSPSVFASLLDHDKGGHFRISAAVPCVTKQLYLPSSCVLMTRFMSTEGVGEVVDFMPIDHPETASDRHRIVRVIRTIRGVMPFALECAPRFDYGRAEHEVQLSPSGAVFTTPGQALTLHSPIALEQSGRDVRAQVTLTEGAAAALILETGTAPVTPVSTQRAEVVAMIESAVEHWRNWLRRSTYDGRWREVVERSAMTLRLLTYAPTGALVAAATAGLPEQVGGERNWDYRFTWVRDASFSVYALLGLGYVDEAMRFLMWLNERIVAEAGEGSGPLKIMYRVDGTSDLREETLDHFEGYRGSRPVRIGNGAADQLQLDIYGEAMDSIYQAELHGLRIGHPGWTHLRGIMDWLASNWDSPEEGIWETRGGREDFTYGRLMSWVAFDRTIRIAQNHGLPADLQRLIAERDRVYEQVIRRGWNSEKKAFVQHYRTDVLDASVLLMPLVGFVSPTDPMWISTLNAVDRELVSDSLVYRYNPEASPDGLRGQEGTFTICTYWYADALARSGRLTEAQLVLEKMLTYANPVGLFAEEIGLTGEQLGNFPQAFSHLAYINAAINLNAALDRETRR